MPEPVGQIAPARSDSDALACRQGRLQAASSGVLPRRNPAFPGGSVPLIAARGAANGHGAAIQARHGAQVGQSELVAGRCLGASPIGSIVLPAELSGGGLEAVFGRPELAAVHGASTLRTIGPVSRTPGASSGTPGVSLGKIGVGFGGFGVAQESGIRYLETRSGLQESAGDSRQTGSGLRKFGSGPRQTRSGLRQSASTSWHFPSGRRKSASASRQIPSARRNPGGLPRRRE